MKWINVKDSLPEIDKYVLVYYTIPNSSKLGEIRKYLEIARVDSITLYGNNKKSVSWQDKEYNGCDPLYWMPLPEYPIEDV